MIAETANRTKVLYASTTGSPSSHPRHHHLTYLHYTHPCEDEGSPSRQLDLETYLADVSIGCSNPPQGEMEHRNIGEISFKIKLSTRRTFIFSCLQYLATEKLKYLELPFLSPSSTGFHAIDMETGLVQDLYVPSHGRGGITPHAIIALPRPGLVELLLCYDSESLINL